MINKLNSLINHLMILTYISSQHAYIEGYLERNLIDDKIIINERRAYISNLWVKESLRGQGIGTYLLKKFIKNLDDLGVIHVELDDVSDNYKKNKNIYIKFGFKYKRDDGPEMTASVRSLMNKI
jgi:ribosomal protein S18 acetylase RimI-like enzyme